MSNDLISREKITQEISEILADVLISGFRAETISFDSINHRIQECLKNQPTAYDIDAVVEQLEKLKQIEYEKEDECDDEGRGDGEQIFEDGVSHGKYAAYRKVIEIVKDGGNR